MLGSLLGGLAQTGLSLFGKNKEIEMQKKFAKNGIQWKVEDAKKAGIHPLYALGANTMSYSPVGVGDSFGWLSDMGQNIDRAREAASGRESRGITAALEKLSLEKAGLENDLLRSEIRKNNAQIGPAMPGGAFDARGPLSAFGVEINPKSSETPAQKWEDEYGDWADAIGAARLLRDAGTNLTDSKIKQILRDNFSFTIREGSVADEIWRWFNNRQISYSGKGDRLR